MRNDITIRPEEHKDYKEIVSLILQSFKEGTDYSDGTDIIALIVKKFSGIQIGKALLITDVLIVLVGGILSNITILISSFLGLLVKTLGIDLVIWMIKKFKDHKKEEKTGAC